MVYPRQRLYDVNHQGFAEAVLGGGFSEKRAEELTAAEARFREGFAELTGIGDAIALSRGRLAGYFAVKAAVREGRRKVVMSAFTIFDLVNMVIVAGGQPHFVDVDKDDVHVTAETVKSAIDHTTAAVIITHYHTSNREIGKIAQVCRAAEVKLIEDCAISLGARVEGAHVGTFGDYALFSFGLFKFISTYFGGCYIAADPQDRLAAETEMALWPRMRAADLWPYFTKGMKLSLMTQRDVFSLFTFPLFRFGYLHNIDIIKKQAQNDPDPHRRITLPESFQRRPSLFQLSEYTRQFANVERDRAIRLRHAYIYRSILQQQENLIIPDRVDNEQDCYLNFPVVICGRREQFVQGMMRAGFDVAVYYYRNCAALDCYKEFQQELPHLQHFVDQMVFFPTYPAVPDDYVRDLAIKAKELAGALPA